MRASIEAEKLGYPSASLVCEGFLGQGATTASGFGMPNIPLAKVPGHVDLQTKEELTKNVNNVTVDLIVKAVTIQPEAVKSAVEPGLKDIVFSGSFEEVNKFFLENEWSDGLPVVPPTISKVEEFLKFTARKPDEVIGVLMPANREVKIWNVAVNGVMAGCRPEYMPVLISLIEAMADHKYGVEHSGNTPGSETLITINGPIIKDLNFNYEQGVLRDGYQANTSIGRFWRLSLMNLAGFLLHKTDKGTFGGTWKVVLAENEDAVAKIGWKPTSVDMGFKAGDNVVTISRHTGSGVIVSVVGSDAKSILPYITDSVLRQVGWEMLFTTTPDMGCSQKPHLILSPVLAETFAKSGWSKKDVQNYLFQNARMPAWKAEKYVNDWTKFVPGSPKICDMVKKGSLPKLFCESDDPNRMVPIVCSPDDFLITVSGDPLRSNAFVFVSNGILGFTTTKKINLPPNWSKLLKEAKEK